MAFDYKAYYNIFDCALGHTHYILWSTGPDRDDFDLLEDWKK